MRSVQDFAHCAISCSSPRLEVPLSRGFREKSQDNSREFQSSRKSAIKPFTLLTTSLVGARNGRLAICPTSKCDVGLNTSRKRVATLLFRYPRTSIRSVESE